MSRSALSSPPSAFHICPVAGCGTRVDNDRLLCARCWARVPARVQKTVYTTFKAFQKSAGQPNRDRLAAGRAYEIQRGHAIAWAERKTGGPRSVVAAAR